MYGQLREKSKNIDPFQTHLDDPLLDDPGEVDDGGEEGEDLEEDGERVADLNVVLGLEAHDQRLGDLVVPLVAHVAVVLVVDAVVGVGGVAAGRVGALLRLVLHAELGHEARVANAFLTEKLLK